MCSDGVLEQMTNTRLAEVLSVPDTTDSEKMSRIKAVCDAEQKTTTPAS